MAIVHDDHTHPWEATDTYYRAEFMTKSSTSYEWRIRTFSGEQLLVAPHGL